MADITSPQLRFPGAGRALDAAPPETVDPIEQASIDTETPPNVLRALADDGGLDAAQTRQLAVKLAGSLRQGRKMREALAETLPGSSPEDVERIVGRALDIAGVPVTKHPLRQAAAGVADVASGLAAAPSLIMSGDLGGEDAARAKAATKERQAADWEAKLAAAKSPEERGLIEQQIETLRAEGSRRTAAADAMADAAPLGESRGLRAAAAVREGVADLVGRPDPRDDSFSGQLARGAGQFAGMVPLALLGPVGLGAAGAAGVGMTGEQMYREAIDSGADEPTARAAADWGSVLGTTEMLPLSNAFKLLPPSLRGQITSAFLRGVAKVGMQAGEEGVQEFASQVAQNIVAQKLYDPERGAWDGAATAGAIGAILGGGLGVPAGIGEMRRRGEEEPAAQPAPAATSAEQMPEPASVENQSVTAAPVAKNIPENIPELFPAAASAPASAPSGPLSAAASRGPQPVLGVPPGAQVTLETPEGTFTGILVGETMEGARVNVDGEEGVISRQEIESGEVRILPAEAAAPDIGNAMSVESTAPQVDETPVPVDETVPEVADSAPPVTSPSSEVVEPAPAPTPGPVSEASAPAAPAPRPETPAGPQTADEARQRLAFITEQGRTNGWNGRLSAMRTEAEETLARLEAVERSTAETQGMVAEQDRAAADVEMQPDPLPNGAGEIQESADAALAGGSEAVAPPPDGSVEAPAAGVRAPAADEPAAPRAPALTDVDLLPMPERRATNLQFSGKGKWDGATEAERRALVERAGYVGESARLGREIAAKKWYQVDGKTKAAIVNASREMEAVGSGQAAEGPSWWDQASQDDRTTIAAVAGIIEAKNAPWANLDEDTRGELVKARAKGEGTAAPIPVTRPAASASDLSPTIAPIRTAAAVVRGIDQATADKIASDLKISLKLDKSVDGFIFGRKHVERVQAALDAAPAAAKAGAPVPTNAKATRVKPLYVARDVQTQSTGALNRWAKAQGFKSIVSDLHVTEAFSRDPVDWDAVEDRSDFLDFDLNGVMPEKLGNAVVLPIPDDGRLAARWQAYRGAGASWDFDGYRPHVTITYDAGDVDLAKVEPFTGRISLGEEVKAPLDPDAVSKVKETPLAEASKPKREPSAHERMREAAKKDAAEQSLRESVTSIDGVKGGTLNAVDRYAPLEVSTPGYTGSRQLILRRGTIPAVDKHSDTTPRVTSGGKAAEIVAAADKGHQPIDWLFATRQNEAKVGAEPKWRMATVVGKAGETWVGLSPIYFDFIRRNKLGLRYAGNDTVLAVVNSRGETVGAVAMMRVDPERAARQAEIAKEGAEPVRSVGLQSPGDGSPAPGGTVDQPEPAVDPIRDEAGRYAPREEVDDAEVVESDDKASISAKIPESRFVSADALRLHLEADPKLGGVVSKLVESGRLVLHDGPETLPGGEGLPSLRSDAPLQTIDSAVDDVSPTGIDSKMIVIGGASDALLAADAPDLPLIVYTDVVRKALNKHGMSKEDVKAALRGLYAPAMILDSSPAAHAPDGSLVVLVERKSQGRPVSLAVHVNSRGPGRGEIRINRIATITDRTPSAIQNWIDGGLTKVLGPKAGAWVRSVGLHLPPDGSPMRRRIKTITHGDGAVKKSVRPDSPRARWIAKRAAARERVQGITTPDGTIHLVASNLNSQTALPVLLHEAFHAGGEPLIGSDAWNATMRRLSTIMEKNTSEWAQTARQRLAEGGQSGPEEFAAYAIENRAGAPAGLLEVIDRLLGRIKAFLLQRFGAQVGAVTPAQLEALAVAALRAGTVGERRHGDFRYSVAAAGAPSVAQVEKAERGLIGHALTKAMSGNYNLLALVPGRGLFAELAKNMPAGQDYLGFKQEMDAMRHSWHARADEVAQAWRKLGLRGDGNREMMDLMHESTLAGVDPSGPFISNLSDEDHDAIAKGRRNAGLMERRAEDQGRALRHAELRQRFEALPEGYRAMFERVRDTYKALDDEQDKVLLENIGKAMDGALRAAERAHEAEIARIRDDGMTGRARDEATAEADTRLARAKRRQGWGKRAKMADLRKQFETQKLPEPYFPLARFGQFFVTVRDKQSGAIVSFERFESPRLQEKAAKAYIGNTDVTVEKGALGDDATLKDMVNPAFVADVENILGKAGVDEGVMDAIWQRWLETLPDLSNRKSRIHRKGTAGFSSDAFRAFGDHLFHGAHQLARLKWSMDMNEALDLAEAAAKIADDPVRAGLIVNEMRKRHAFVMNPKGAPWAQSVTSAAFVFYLAATPAAALVNLSQTAIVGVPVLGAFGGTGRASAHLLRALRDFAGGSGESWRDTISAANNDRLTADEKTAMEEAYRRSTIDASQAHDLAGVSESGVKYSAARTAIMAKIAWGFHHTERLNREVTFLAAYRLAREKGLDHTAAVDKASDLTWRTHFDYQSTSRPRVMQSDVAKVLLVFRNFQVNMLWRLFRDLHQSLNAKDAEERHEARVQLAGTTGMLMLLAGATGTWGYSLIMALAGLFFDDGKDEAEDSLQRALVEAVGTTAAGMILKGVPGYLSGIDLTSRIGMPDLWFRSSDRNLEGEDEFHYWVSQFLGAGVGMAESMWRGVSMMKDGEVYRGVEAMAPKAVRDLMRSYRYLQDGVTTYKGDSVIDDVDWRDLTKQAIGFTPARVSERYDRNTRAKNKEQRIMDERSAAMAEYTRPLAKGEKPPSAALQGITAFNQEYPDYKIDSKSIKASVSARRRSSEKMDGGIMLNPKIAPRIRREEPPALF